MRVQSINLNMIPTGVEPIIYLSQYDEEDDGALLFMIYNGSTLYDLTDCSAVIEGTKPDETVFSYPCTVYTNYITSAVYQQMATVEGTYEAEIRISNDDEVIGTLNFQIVVEAAGVSTVDLSETDVPTLIESIQNSVNEAEYWAEQGVKNFNGRSGSVLPVAGDYDAEMITYDNSISGMTATNVQAAIDELEARDASDLEYDNTTSGLSATNAQAAIDELATEAQAAEARDGDAYNSATTYGPTDNTSGYPSYCIENSKIYKNIASCTGVAPSADTSGTYWEETDISTELSELNSDITDINSDITDINNGIVANTQLISDTVGWTGKNKCPRFSNYSQANVIFTVDNNGVVDITTTAAASANVWDIIDSGLPMLENGKKYKVSGFGTSANQDGYIVGDNNGADYVYVHDVGSGGEFTYDSSKPLKKIQIGLRSGQTASHIKLSPMIYDADIFDDTYEPYHDTVEDEIEQLTAEKAENSAIAPVESGTTASQAYAGNDFFIRDGTLYKVISGIAQGGTITENTNCTATTISEILTALLNA